MFLKICGCRTDHAFAIHDAAHAQVGIFQNTELESHINAFAHDVNFMVGQAKPHFNIWIFVVKFRNPRCDQPSSKAKRGGDANRSFRIFRQFRHRRFCLIDGFEDFQRAIIEYAAMFGGGQLACRPVEETHAQMLLQLLDSIARDGWRCALVAACRRKISQFDNAHKNAQIIKIRHSDTHQLYIFF